MCSTHDRLVAPNRVVGTKFYAVATVVLLEQGQPHYVGGGEGGGGVGMRLSSLYIFQFNPIARVVAHVYFCSYVDRALLNVL